MTPSAFGWYAIDPDQRRRMMEAVDLFREKATIDDLGIGGIRDSFSDVLFPGTSTLQTRLRYVLFVPWLMQASMHRDTEREMQTAFRDLEYRFIDVLMHGGEALGVFGRQSGRELQRLPSIAYWGALLSWGIVEPGMSTHNLFQRSVLRREEQKNLPQAEDLETRLELTPTGFDSGLPEAPANLLTEATFALRAEDAEYIAEAILRTHPKSLLAHLVLHRPSTWTDLASAPTTPWDPLVREGLPADLEGVVDRAQKFSASVHGASLLYNLLVAEEAGNTTVDDETDENVQRYRGLLAEWSEEAANSPRITPDDQQAIWGMVLDLNRRITTHTRTFLSTWFDTAPDSRDIANDRSLRDLVRGRERQVKGSRGRLGNRRALDLWGGASGVGRLDFRWSYARQHLQDIYDGAEAA